MEKAGFSIIFIIIGLVWLFIQAGKKSAKTGENNEKDFDEILLEIPHVWNPEGLKKYLWFEEGAWDEDEEEALLKAYHRQLLFLMKIEHGDPKAQKAVAQAILSELGEDPSWDRKAHVRSLFEWVIERYPDLEELFQEENEPPPKGYASPKSDLFAQCKSLEEVKKRFRRLSMLNHPDRGGSEAAMKVILAQYERACERFGN
jgi:hypothetical protein